jgi:hypothetical protein
MGFMNIDSWSFFESTLVGMPSFGWSTRLAILIEMGAEEWEVWWEVEWS